MNAARVRECLLGWYRRNRRDLPWRRTRDPYAIWVAETMLQQTRVETVIPYYERFLERFPDVWTLADAPLDDVLGAWAGLGYYSRARNLRAAAAQLCDRNDGRLPGEVGALRALPGVGRYTAGAVASIAFDRPAPVVDGNVARVLTRLLDLDEPIDARAVRDRLWREAERLARGPDPGDLNQALMELGARVCVPRSPRCGACPLRRLCRGRRAGRARELPVRAPKRRPREVSSATALVLRRGFGLAVRRPPHGLLGGLWELPQTELGAGETPEAGVVRALRETVGLSPDRIVAAGLVEHAFSHRLLRLHVFRCDVSEGRVRRVGFDAHRWVAPARIGRLPLGTVTRKAVAKALAVGDAAAPRPAR